MRIPTTEHYSGDTDLKRNCSRTWEGCVHRAQKLTSNLGLVTQTPRTYSGQHTPIPQHTETSSQPTLDSEVSTAASTHLIEVAAHLTKQLKPSLPLQHSVSVQAFSERIDIEPEEVYIPYLATLNQCTCAKYLGHPPNSTCIRLDCHYECKQCSGYARTVMFATCEFYDSLCDKREFGGTTDKFKGSNIVARDWNGVTIRKMFQRLYPDFQSCQIEKMVWHYHNMGSVSIFEALFQPPPPGRLALAHSTGVPLLGATSSGFLSALCASHTGIHTLIGIVGAGGLISSASVATAFLGYAAFQGIKWWRKQYCRRRIVSSIYSECSNKETSRSDGPLDGNEHEVDYIKTHDSLCPEGDNRLQPEYREEVRLDRSDCTLKILGRTPVSEDSEAGARLIGFAQPGVACFANSPENLTRTFRSRVFKDPRQRQFTGNKSDLARIKRAVDGLLKNVFNLEEFCRVTNFTTEFDFISKSWPKSRVDREIDIYNSTQEGNTGPTEIMVKTNEVLNKEKEARLIVNSGGQQQLHSAMLVGLIEKMLFSGKFEVWSIKNRDKSSVFQSIKKAWLTNHYTYAHENDFSSFEFSIGEFIQNEIERPIYRHIYAMIKHLTTLFQPEEALRVKMRRNERFKTRRLYHDKSGEISQLKVLLNFIVKHSGDRGTSVMNWLVNCILHVCAYGDMGLVDRVFGKQGFDEHGGFVYKDHHYNFRFEGDDGLTLTSNPRELTPFFEKMGFLAKFRTTKAGETGYLEFTGWHIFFGNTGVLTTPDAPRALINSNYTFAQGNLAALAFVSFASRAMDFSGNYFMFMYFYTMAMLYYRDAKGHEVTDRNLAVKLSLIQTGDVTENHNLIPEKIKNNLDEEKCYQIPDDVTQEYMSFMGLGVADFHLDGLERDLPTVLSHLPISFVRKMS